MASNTRITRTLLPLLVAVAFVACNPGPLPQVALPTVDTQDSFPSSSEEPLPIDRAIIRGDLAELRSLLAQGLNPNVRWSRRGDRLPIMEVLESPSYHYPIDDRAAYLQALLAHGADPDAKWCPFESRGDWGNGLPHCTSATARSALHLAAFYGDREVVTLLLDAGADPSWRDWSGASPLDYAYDEIVFELISRAMFPSLDTRDQQALAWVRQYDGGPYVNTPWRGTPLGRALSEEGGTIIAPQPPVPFGTYVDVNTWSHNRSLSRVRTLLRLGASPNERVGTDGFDWTPLALALSTLNDRAAAVLLQHGADVNQRWCSRVEYRDYRRMVRADAACSAKNGMTPLMLAAARNDRSSVELLLAFRADLSLRDWAGRTALDYANNTEIKDLIGGLGGSGISKN